MSSPIRKFTAHLSGGTGTKCTLLAANSHWERKAYFSNKRSQIRGDPWGLKLPPLKGGGGSKYDNCVRQDNAGKHCWPNVVPRETGAVLLKETQFLFQKDGGGLSCDTTSRA